MPWVTLRHFIWTEKASSGGPVEVDDFTRVRADIELPVNVSELVYVNALAPAGKSTVKYATRVHELALITTYLRTRRDDALTLDTSDFRSSSLHIKRFVTESLGLGMLTATVEALFHWNSRNPLHNFDALPTALAHAYAKRGPRPDLLFEFGHAELAGEARGRSASAPTRPQAAQRQRLDSLINWSRLHSDHDIVMTWAYLTSSGITVDIYTRSTDAPWLPDDFGELLPPERNLWLENVAELRKQLPSNRVEKVLRLPDPTSPSELALSSKRNIDQVTRQLFETAPISDVLFAGQPLRGRWVPANVIEPASGVLLLGVLADDVTEERSSRLAALLSEQGRISATVRGRLIVVHAPSQNGQAWHLLRDVR